MINEHESDHIITIEDPIEYVYPKGSALINQRDINIHTHDTAAAMRAALREDPDIIVVGEMRDLETMHLAIEAAETGRWFFPRFKPKVRTKPSIVFWILFRQSKLRKFKRFFPGSLKGVVSQQLVKKADGSGMTLATEVLLNNPSLANMIREGKTFQIPSVMQMGRAHGMITMEESLVEMMKKGIITPGEAAAKSADPRAFRTKYAVKEEGGSEKTPAAPAAAAPKAAATPAKEAK
ncbi:MAG: ATPase, T2SS/T4P/T4SS family [Bdellovibrionota bacterium]